MLLIAEQKQAESKGMEQTFREMEEPSSTIQAGDHIQKNLMKHSLELFKTDAAGVRSWW